jgi:hypothetical protein
MMWIFLSAAAPAARVPSCPEISFRIIETVLVASTCLWNRSYLFVQDLKHPPRSIGRELRLDSCRTYLAEVAIEDGRADGDGSHALDGVG